MSKSAIDHYLDHMAKVSTDAVGDDGEIYSIQQARAELAALRADVAKYDDAEEWRQHYLRRTNDLEEISGGLRKRIEELDSVLVDYDDLRQRVAELEAKAELADQVVEIYNDVKGRSISDLGKAYESLGFQLAAAVIRWIDCQQPAK